MSSVSIHLNSIPASLKQQRRWVLWRYEEREGKKTKVPYSPHLGPADERFSRAKSNNLRTWGAFADVCRHLSHMEGVGFMLGDGFCGVDLDKVRDPKSGEFLAWGKLILAKLDTYAEISPSSTGVKLLVRATKPDGRCVWTGWPSYDGQKEGRVEIYCRGRFFTVTGCHVEGTPDEVQDRQDEIGLLCGSLGGEKAKDRGDAVVVVQAPVPDSTDEDIIRLAGNGPSSERFVRLWMGDTSDYDGDESRADLALCSLLARHTGPNPDQIDRLFRRSRLCREKWDRQDYRRRTITKAVAKAKEQKPLVAGKGRSAESSDRHADIIVGIGRGCKLWHDAMKNGYASLPSGGNVRVTSTDFRRWLINEYLGRYGRTVSRSAVDEALATLDAVAVHQGPLHRSYLRAARTGNTIFIDLGDASWDAVIVTSDGWQIGRPPVRFIRSANVGVLPRPESGGSVELLRRYVNVPPEDFPLVAGSILDALKSDGPYLATVVVGEQGSAKSTLCRVIKKLLDPAPEGTEELNDMPRDARDLGIDGHNNFVLAYDNISKLPPWISDAFCRVSTGGTIKARKLYTDSEQTIFSICRPLLLNGISEFATASDLLSRAVLIHAEWLPEEDRLDEVTFWDQFNRDRPAILGVLYQALACGLRSGSTIRLDRKPRMASTATWIAACFPSLGWAYEDWWLPYSASQQTANDISLDTSPVGTAVLMWWQIDNAFQPWEGTASQLRDLARSHCDEQQIRYWPLNGKTFADRLRRVVSCLRCRKLQVAFYRKNNARLIRLSTFAGDAEVTEVTQPVVEVTQVAAQVMHAQPQNTSSGGSPPTSGDAARPKVTQGDAAKSCCVTGNNEGETERNLYEMMMLRQVSSQASDAGDAGDALFSFYREEGARKPQTVNREGLGEKAGESASPASLASPGLLGDDSFAGDVVCLPDLPVPARLVGYFPQGREWTVEMRLGAEDIKALPSGWRDAAYQLNDFRCCQPELWRARVTPEGRPLPSQYPKKQNLAGGASLSCKEVA